MSEADQALRQAFETQMKLAGVTVPPDRVEATFAGYVELQHHIARLRVAMPASAEPANVFMPPRSRS